MVIPFRPLFGEKGCKPANAEKQSDFFFTTCVFTLNATRATAKPQLSTLSLVSLCRNGPRVVLLTLESGIGRRDLLFVFTLEFTPRACSRCEVRGAAKRQRYATENLELFFILSVGRSVLLFSDSLFIINQLDTGDGCGKVQPNGQSLM